jgi:hypothetical protein
LINAVALIARRITQAKYAKRLVRLEEACIGNVVGKEYAKGKDKTCVRDALLIYLLHLHPCAIQPAKIL